MADRGYQFERHKTDSDDLERVQDNVQRTVEQLNRRVLIERVAFPGAASVTVKHPLGRVPARWWVVRVTGGYFEAYETARTATKITFASTNACIVDLEME